MVSLQLKSDEKSDFVTRLAPRALPRLPLILGAIAVLAIIAFAPGMSGLVRSAFEVVGWPPATDKPKTAPAKLAPAQQTARAVKDAAKAKEQGAAASDALVKLDAEQIAGAGIETAAVTGGDLVRRLPAPGIIVPSGKRIGRVAVKIVGMIAELRKNLGDPVAKGEVVAVLESREMGDAKSEYLAARSFDALQQTLFARAKALWEKRIATEQQYLRAEQAAVESRIKMELAREKLFILGLTESEIAALPSQPPSALSRQDIRSPIAGRVAERRVDIGSMLGRDNLETELFLIVDLDEVWAELAVTPSDLAFVKEGQKVTIFSHGSSTKAEGRIIFISPMLDKDTRSAKAVVLIANPDGVWRPGVFVTGEIATDEQKARVLVPPSALQVIDGEPTVFVRTLEGFEKRPVVIGRRDLRAVEILSGLEPGETIAVRNTFKLKAELGKAAAEE